MQQPRPRSACRWSCGLGLPTRRQRREASACGHRWCIAPASSPMLPSQDCVTNSSCGRHTCPSRPFCDRGHPSAWPLGWPSQTGLAPRKICKHRATRIGPRAKPTPVTDHVRCASKADLALRAVEVGCCLSSGHDVATKLRCLGLCKVEMSLGGLAGSVSRRRGDQHIGAAPASRGSF